MKSLIQFLEANQHFLVKGHLKKQYRKSVMNFPVLIDLRNDADYDYEFVKFKKIEIGNGPFFIYNDKYHNKKHIASLGDIISSIGYNYFDFEDFSEKDIIAEFKTIKEAFIYMLKDNGITDSEINALIKMNHNEAVEWIENHKGTNGYYDNINIAVNVIQNKMKDADFIIDCGEVLDNAIEVFNIKNLPDNYKKG